MPRQLANLEFHSKEQVRQFLKAFRISNATVHGDLSVDVEGDVDFSQIKMAKCPVRFRKVTGFCSFEMSGLITLEGLPDFVGHNLYLNHNKLKSLTCFPKAVQGDIYLQYNEIISLEGIAKEVIGNLYCHGNHLKNLDYFPHCPKKVCLDNNLLTDLEELDKLSSHIDYERLSVKDNPFSEGYELLDKVKNKVLLKEWKMPYENEKELNDKVFSMLFSNHEHYVNYQKAKLLHDTLEKTLTAKKFPQRGKI